MQIMPGTAAHLSLPMSMIHEPEANVAAAARYMAELQGHFSDVGDLVMGNVLDMAGLP